MVYSVQLAYFFSFFYYHYKSVAKAWNSLDPIDTGPLISVLAKMDERMAQVRAILDGATLALKTGDAHSALEVRRGHPRRRLV